MKSKALYPVVSLAFLSLGGCGNPSSKQEDSEVMAATKEVQVVECKTKDQNGKILPTVRVLRAPGTNTIKLKVDGLYEAQWKGSNDGEIATGGQNTTFVWSWMDSKDAEKPAKGSLISMKGKDGSPQSKAIENATGLTIVALTADRVKFVTAAIRVDGVPGMNYLCNGGSTLINVPGLTR